MTKEQPVDSMVFLELASDEIKNTIIKLMEETDGDFFKMAAIGSEMARQTFVIWTAIAGSKPAAAELLRALYDSMIDERR